MSDPPRHSPTDAQGERARRGDREAFAGLYERLAPALYAWAAMRIHPRHRGRLDPADVVQDVWWRALDRFASFEPSSGSFRAWIFRIATNALTDGFRRLNVRGQIPGPKHRAAQQSLPEDLVARATSISRQVARQDDVRSLIEAAGSLEPEDRSLVALCGLEGVPAADAAPVLGISKAAATKRWQRLRARLRESPVWRSLLLVDGEA